jgi:hypothetical protein
MRPIIASMAFLTKCDSSGGLPGIVVRSAPKNPAERHRRMNRLPNIATIPAAVIEADRDEALTIEFLYITSGNYMEVKRGNSQRRKLCT